LSIPDGKFSVIFLYRIDIKTRAKVGEAHKSAIMKTSKILQSILFNMLIIESFSQGNDVNFTSITLITLSVVDELVAPFEVMKG
jgi:hypothetical protein